MKKIPLSVVIPAYNEGKNLGSCLESVSWAEEIIVVDGGSHDETVDIARNYDAVVLETDNAPAETQRLKALANISQPWFLLLDADERVSEGLKDQIQEVIQSRDSLKAYAVLRRNFYRGRPIHLHHPDYQLRLFRKELAPYLPDRIHRLPEISEETGRMDGTLIHLFFTTVHDYLEKLNRYTTLEAVYWRRDQKKVSGLNTPYYLFLRPLARFFHYYFFKKGFLDGFFGFFYSVSSAYYDWAVAARVLIDPPSPGDKS